MVGSGLAVMIMEVIEVCMGYLGIRDDIDSSYLRHRIGVSSISLEQYGTSIA